MIEQGFTLSASPGPDLPCWQGPTEYELFVPAWAGPKRLALDQDSQNSASRKSACLFSLNVVEYPGFHLPMVLAAVLFATMAAFRVDDYWINGYRVNGYKNR